MADSIIQGLFGASPYDVEQAQNQRLFQSADRYAQQSPIERSAGQMYRAGGMLGGAGAEAAGMVNPQVQEAQQVQMIMSQIDPNTAEGLTKGALLANQMRNPKLAFLLSKAAQERKVQESEMRLKYAHAKYYETGGSKGKSKDDDPVQLAKEINRARAAAKQLVFSRNGTVQDAEDAADVAGAQARIEWENTGAAKKSSIPEADSTGRIPLSDELGMRIEGGVTPEMKRIMIADALASGDLDAVRTLRSIPATKIDGAGGTKAESAGAVEGAKEGQKLKEYYDPRIKKVRLMSGEEAMRIGATPAEFSPEAKRETSIASAEGSGIGKEKSLIGGKYDALDAVAQAKKLIKDGIYSGGYGTAQLNIAKYTPGADKAKVARTEEFLSHIGNIVIPRLQEFGGNDSVEELRYLRQVMGGEIKLEEAALSKILESAEAKIQRGIRRLSTVTDDSNKSPSGMSALPPPSQHTGKVVKDTVTNIRYKSDGTKWVAQ